MPGVCVWVRSQGIGNSLQSSREKWGVWRLEIFASDAKWLHRCGFSTINFQQKADFFAAQSGVKKSMFNISQMRMDGVQKMQPRLRRPDVRF
jgi:hypothetical protein